MITTKENLGDVTGLGVESLEVVHIMFTEHENSGEFVVRSNDGFNYWSNELGWTYYPEHASRFTEEEKSTLELPIGDCSWVEVPLDWVVFTSPQH